MSSPLKPMLAETLEDASKLTYPVIASPKLDGIRCLIVDGKALSRSLKPIPNQHVQAWAAKYAAVLNGLDGELIVGDMGPSVFNRTTSAIMSKDGPEDFVFWCFDCWDKPDLPYTIRMRDVKNRLYGAAYRGDAWPCGHPDKFRRVPSTTCQNGGELLAFEQDCLDRGFEGAMVRKPDGPYKYGRSTLKEGYLLKVKRFKDAEATIIGFQERMHNENEAKTDELGHTERSTHKAGMKPAGDLGAFIVKHAQTQMIFNIGSGFTAEQRKQYWTARNKLMNKVVKFKHFEIGEVDKPRFPIFLGFRDERDM